MSIVGTVESLWRYPVKSMGGEEMDEMFVGVAGVYGDRLFAFKSSAAPSDFPYFTAREQREMLKYRPRLRQVDPEAPASALTLDVNAPTGRMLAIDDPALLEQLRRGVDEKHEISLMRSERPLTDCQPLSIIALQTARQLAEETGTPIDKRRFRANVYLDLTNATGFSEDEFVGRSLRIGSTVVVSVVKRDGRCVLITLDPETGAMSPAILKKVAQEHGGTAGVYAAVLTEGILRKGDSVELLDEPARS